MCPPGRTGRTTVTQGNKWRAPERYAPLFPLVRLLLCLFVCDAVVSFQSMGSFAQIRSAMPSSGLSCSKGVLGCMSIPGAQFFSLLCL